MKNYKEWIAPFLFLTVVLFVVGYLIVSLKNDYRKIDAHYQKRKQVLDEGFYNCSQQNEACKTALKSPMLSIEEKEKFLKIYRGEKNRE